VKVQKTRYGEDPALNLVLHRKYDVLLLYIRLEEDKVTFPTVPRSF